MKETHLWPRWLPVLLVVAFAGPAGAQNNQQDGSFEEILFDRVWPIIYDVDVILLEGPKFLAKRLPGMQAAGDFGAQMDLVKLGDFSVGIGILAGIFPKFDQMQDQFYNDPAKPRAKGIPKQLPPTLPVPVAMLIGRAAVTEDLEVDLRFGFFPNFEVKSQDFLIRGTTSIYGAKVRHRTFRGHGIVPNLISSADGSYFTGFIDIGRDYTFTLGNTGDFLGSSDRSTLNQLINQEVFDGQSVLGGDEAISVGAFFRGAPVIGWDIWQLSLEERAQWDVGFWRPFLGFGLDLATGHVDGGIDNFEIDVRATGPAHLMSALKQANIHPKILGLFPRQEVTIRTTDVRQIGARAIAGMEFNLGGAIRLPLEGQFDFTENTYIAGFGVRYAYR